jgi:hypothetical protein
VECLVVDEERVESPSTYSAIQRGGCKRRALQARGMVVPSLLKYYFILLKNASAIDSSADTCAYFLFHLLYSTLLFLFHAILRSMTATLDLVTMHDRMLIRVGLLPCTQPLRCRSRASPRNAYHFKAITSDVITF